MGIHYPYLAEILISRHTIIVYETYDRNTHKSLISRHTIVVCKTIQKHTYTDLFAKNTQLFLCSQNIEARLTNHLQSCWKENMLCWWNIINYITIITFQLSICCFVINTMEMVQKQNSEVDWPYVTYVKIYQHDEPAAQHQQAN